ncbi:MAG: hypothetical protein CVU60_10205 [Deltaproteobacteria bacterium HGW-Deltaproteobacteria-18]|nr:MAG: hypothetical protein CVU60_10205 [Deltaproteobacteria bacterium HGW-Deltaproteobacteria-18]PKN48324.1 MAG: hypothetical protein CVU63_05400 [Deltaproteobacteria bacterium HGW-Deltaproteobacteria-20]
MIRCRCYIIMILVFWAGSALAAEPLGTSLANIQRAIDRNDHVLLEKYVDLRGIITRGVDRFVADYAANPPGGEGDPLMEMLSGGLSREADSAAAVSMKMMLVEETRKFVIRGVASGDFSGRPSKQATLPDGGLLAILFADASTARKELRGLRVNPAKGDTATAQATLHDFGSERDYPVQMALKLQPEGYWKVTDVKNMADLIRRVRKEAEER